jgi:hypothetical protein
MKQFGTINTPFTPANPALDIPDGDPRELNTITNQALNNIYGELYGAIKGSGQELTDVNGTNPDLTQLSNAIGTQSIGGQYYSDIGGSTSNTKNIMNSSGYTQEIKVGSIITFHNTIPTNAGGGVITINVYNKPGELQMSAPLLFQGANLLTGLTSQVWGNNQVSAKTLVTVIRTELGFELMKTATVNVSQTSVTFFTGHKPFTIVTVPYGSTSFSTTDYNTIALPVTFADITSITITPAQNSWSTNLFAANVRTLNSGNIVQFITYNNGTVSPVGAGYIAVMGYTDYTL